VKEIATAPATSTRGGRDHQERQPRQAAGGASRRRACGAVSPASRV
jgi:hypothetical protein